MLLSGQTEFIEKYEEVIGELQVRGFTVATMDWRGQGGSDRLLPDRLKAHIGTFTQYDDDLRSFMQQVVMPLGDARPIALAHSMGGHILLRALHENPELVSAAVLSAPMLRASTRGYPRWLARALTAIQNLMGRRNAWVLGMAGRDPVSMTFDAQLVTSDVARFERNRQLCADHPDLRLAGPTWGWLEAAYRTMAMMMAPGYAEAITTPILLIGAGKDRIVDTEAARTFTPRLPNGTYLELADAEHEILMERDDVRARFWAAFDGFARKIKGYPIP